MFEAHVLSLLRKYLDEYIYGISEDALRISVWKGDVELKDLSLREDALNRLKLPIKVKAGFVGSITLKVPWSRLGNEPVVVLLDRIFLLAEPGDAEFPAQSMEEQLKAKLKEIEEREAELVNASNKQKGIQGADKAGTSWIGSLIATIIGNLKFTVTNVHIRFEDSREKNPFCAGLTLQKLAAFTIDDSGHETFVTSGALDQLHKSVHLERLAVYHDTKSQPLTSKKSWKEMSGSEWSQMFEAGIASDITGRQFLLHPLGGSLMYLRRRKFEERAADVPLHDLSAVLNQVEIHITQPQYRDIVHIGDLVSVYQRRLEVCHLRPAGRFHGNTAVWWKYAVKAVMLQHKISQPFSWPNIREFCDRRRQYIPLYTSSLLSPSPSTTEKLQSLELAPPAEVILLWRMLAHSQAEKIRPKSELSGPKPSSAQGWRSYLWGSSSPVAASDSSVSTSDTGLSEEEWAKINELVNFEPNPNEPSMFVVDQDDPFALHFSIRVKMEAAKLILEDDEAVQLLSGSFRELRMGARLFPKSLDVDIKLEYYDLSAPEGTMIKSVSTEGKSEALSAVFSKNPFHQKVDWSLCASMSPCHVTVWRSSIDRVSQFLRTGKETSPELATQTAALFQSTLDDVKRQAQSRIQQVLKNRTRFLLDLDVDAPKVTIPAADSTRQTQILLDLGHFMLKTDQDHGESESTVESALYTRFKVLASDISIFIADGRYDWSLQALTEGVIQNAQQNCTVFLPILDHCRISAVIHQMMVDHPTLPSTRVAIWIPILGFHYSPSRHRRFSRVVASLFPQSPSEQSGDPHTAQSFPTSEVSLPPWKQPEFSGALWELQWERIGGSAAMWHPRWCILAASTVFFFMSRVEENACQTVNLAGKAVVEVPPGLVGGLQNVVAIISRGTDVKQAIRPGSGLVLHIQDGKEKQEWMKRMNAAVYKNSAIFSADGALLEDQPTETSEDSEKEITGSKPSLFIMGALDQLRLTIGSVKPGAKSIDDEQVLLAFRASGGRVEVLQRKFDLGIGIGLHELEVEDHFQGPVSSSCRYVIRSELSRGRSMPEGTATQVPEPKRDNSKSGGVVELSEACEKEDEDDDFDDAEDGFADAEDEFVLSPHSSTKGFSPKVSHGFSKSAGDFFDASDLNLDEDEFHVPSFSKAGSLAPNSGDEASTNFKEMSDFVTVQLTTMQQESPQYSNVDMKIAVIMATLELFCNRKTVVALMEMGTYMSEPLPPQRQEQPALESTSTVNKQPSEKEDSKGSAVGLEGMETFSATGLMGRGKSRVVFQMVAEMERARIFLNKEDGSQLAMLEQERLQVDIKLFPASMRVNCSLGNLRLANLQLGPQHPWRWFCNLRDPDSASLVQVEYNSYNKDDDDYSGYEYSIQGKLSAVRIVFLYRFIQEFMAYFWGLASPGVRQQVMVRVVDAVGGIERKIQQWELAGSSGFHWDISLDAPLLILPKTSLSSDFMELRLGHLYISNSIEWRGGIVEDTAAVRVDLMTIESKDVNLAVGLAGVPGQPMLEKMAGITFHVRRPLRDLFKKLPTYEIHIVMSHLRAVMSEKEYAVITECLIANIFEKPDLPPYFRAVEQQDAQSSSSATTSSPPPPEKHQQQAVLKPSEEVSTQQGSASILQEHVYTYFRIIVDAELAEFELFSGATHDTSIALLKIEGFWLEYFSTTAKEMEVLMTLPLVSILDTRPNSRSETRLMMGSALDVDQAIPTVATSEEGDSHNSESAQSRKSSGSSAPSFLTMFIMNYSSKPNLRSFILRFQRPRLLMALDFILAVGEFFVPSLAAMSGNDSERDEREDPVGLQTNLVLESSHHVQPDPVVELSHACQLILESPSLDAAVYDGAGGSVILNTHDEFVLPIIFISAGKFLQFKNVTIKTALPLDEIIHLGENSGFSTAPEDGVIVDVVFEKVADTASSALGSSTSDTKAIGSTSGTPAQTSSSFSFDLQAISPELTFYDSTKWPTSSLHRPEKLLRVTMDLNFLWAQKGQESWMKGSVKGMTIENASGLSVLKPLNAQWERTCVDDKTCLNMSTSDIAVHLPLNVVRLVHRIQRDVTSALRLGGGPVVARCIHFDCVWSTKQDSGWNHQQFSVWRPRPPAGYVSVGDCITPGLSPPEQAVLALSKSFQRVKKPLGFALVWSTASIGGAHLGSETVPHAECRFWMPLAPPGYSAIGCIAAIGPAPPHVSTVYCVRSDLLCSTTTSDCVLFSRYPHSMDRCVSIWLVENSLHTFFACKGLDLPPPSLQKDLREDLRFNLLHQKDSGSQTTMGSGASPEPVIARNLSSMRAISRAASSRHLMSMQRPFVSASQFEKVWWTKGEGSSRAFQQKHASIWRPLATMDYAPLGDIVVDGLDPPDSCIVVFDELESGRIAKPINFVLRIFLGASKNTGATDLSLWYPVPPPGYVSLGCVASQGPNMPSLDTIRCMRKDLVTGKGFVGRPVWTVPVPPKGDVVISLWPVMNKAHTFLVHSDASRPPHQLGYNLVELEESAKPDNIDTNLVAPSFCCTFFDDTTGVVIPFLDLTVEGIHLTVHGRPEALHAVCLTNVAASSFNAQLGMWEPLMEPFDGIFKYESKSASSNQPALEGGSSNILVTTTSSVNVNVTTNNIDAFAGAFMGWKKLGELEIEARRIILQGGMSEDQGSALGREDTLRILVDNQLGVEICALSASDGYRALSSLPTGQITSLPLPPLKFPEILRSYSAKQQSGPRKFMALRVSCIQGVMKDEVREERFMCKFRVKVESAPQSDGSSARKLPQTARTRAACAVPDVGKETVKAHWDEAFVFEVPEKGGPHLEVVVTNQAASGGRGLIGVALISMDPTQSSIHSSWASLAKNPWGNVEEAEIALHKTFKEIPSTDPAGRLRISTFYFSADYPGHSSSDASLPTLTSKSLDSVLRLGAHPSGPWTPLSSMAAIMTLALIVDSRPLAVDMSVQQGLKCLTLRSLAVLCNSCDIPLQVCVCPEALLDYADDQVTEQVEDEVWENQRYQPLLGWGSSWPGHLLPNDPSKFSSFNLATAFPEMPKVPPSGWVWLNDWHVDRDMQGDEDGWLYGPDFSTLASPGFGSSSRSKSMLDFTRRRRLLRMRQRQALPESDKALGKPQRALLGTLKPGESLSLPWNSLAPSSDYCLQIRPVPDPSSIAAYSWSRLVPRASTPFSAGSSSSALSESSRYSESGSSNSGSPASKAKVSRPTAFVLSDLTNGAVRRSAGKMEEMMVCRGARGSSFWLCLEADATRLQSDPSSSANSGSRLSSLHDGSDSAGTTSGSGAVVADWRISVHAPLKLDNRLPSSAEFFIWEKPAKNIGVSRPVSRQHGIIRRGSAVHVYTADTRCPVLLTWMPQGGWKQEKDPLLISDPWSPDLPASFMMANAESSRKLLVNIEHDLGISEISAKVIRLFVPFWLRNDSGVPLSCRLVETQPTDSLQQQQQQQSTVAALYESYWLSGLSNSRRQLSSLKASPSFAEGLSQAVPPPPRSFSVVRIIEAIEDVPASQPVMLSFPSADNVGIAVALNSSGVFTSALPLKAFEENIGRLDLKAVDSSGSYLKLSVSLDISSLGFEGTKVIRLQPHTVFSNQTGQCIQIRQAGCEQDQQIHHLEENAVRQPVKWQSLLHSELLQVSIDGHDWSGSFSIDSLGTLYAPLRKHHPTSSSRNELLAQISDWSRSHSIFRVEVLDGGDSSRFHVVFRRPPTVAPYRIENRSSLFPLRIKQSEAPFSSWQLLLPGTSCAFTWEDLRSPSKMLEVMVDGADSSSARAVNIDQEGEWEPNMYGGGHSIAPLVLSVFRESPKLMVVCVTDWKPSDLPSPLGGASQSSPRLLSSVSSISTTESGASGMVQRSSSSEGLPSGAHTTTLTVALEEFGVSVVDHTPEELLYVSMHGAQVVCETNSATGSRYKAKVGHLQIDNQLLVSALPVLLTPYDPPPKRREYVLKLTVGTQPGASEDEQVFPYVGLELPSDAWMVNIHEPIVWRIIEMVRKLNFMSMSSSTPSSSSSPTSVSLDPRVHVGFLNISEARIKLSLAMAPSLRPRAIMGMAATMLTTLGNTDEMAILTSTRIMQDISMRRSALISAAIQSVTSDLLSHPFQLLSGLDVLGNASSTLGQVSKGVAAMSMDKTFIRSRQKQESKGSVEGMGDGLREGGEALAKGLYRGVTGILTKPIEGAREGGMEGFMSGVGKGIIGVAAQPMSGMLDLVSKTTDGVNATRQKLAAAISSKQKFKRRRLPRAIAGDNLLRPYNEFAARGQALLHIAERGALLGSTVFDIKEKGKFSMTDAYEHHVELPNHRILVVTNQRAMLVQQPGTLAGQKAPDLTREPCAILWSVRWDELLSLELVQSKEEKEKGLPPSRAVLHLREWSHDTRLLDAKEIARVVVCKGVLQAREVQRAIQQAVDKYGPDRASVAAQTKKRRAESRPLTGASAGAASGAALGLLAGPAAPMVVPVMATVGALVGGAGQAMMESDSEGSLGARSFSGRERHSSLESDEGASFPRGQDVSGGEAQKPASLVIKSFKLAWWDKGAVWAQKFPVSIWRPVPPRGYISVGDIATPGYDQPIKTMVYRDDEDGKFVPPQGFQLVWRDTDSGARTPVTIWTPVPPSGYVALGCVAIPDYYEPHPGIVRCVRKDYAQRAELGRLPIWRDRKGVALWKCSLWLVHNDARTFLARRDHESPPTDLGFDVVAQ